MVSKKSGSGNGKDEGDILSAILRELQKTNRKLDETNARLDETNTKLEETKVELRREMREGFAAVNGRLDNLISTSGAKIREIEARLEALERKVG